MKNPRILIVAILILYSCQQGQQDSQKSNKGDEIVSSGEMVGDYSINWVLDTKSGDGNELQIPLTTIIIKINGKTFNLFDDAQGEYYQLDSTECKSWEIPESALSTILGGYGGLYRCVYVENHENELHIKQAWSDAESDVQGWMDFEIIKRIRPAELTRK